MAKSPDAFRTISEVADRLDTPAHVLRFWESKFTQVRPVKRAGGRRYYRPDDVALLGGIKVLLHEEGLTIKGAQKLMREKGVRHVMELATSLEAGDLVEAEAQAALVDDPATETPEAPFTEAEAATEEATILSFPQSAPEEPPAEQPPEAAPEPEPEPLADSATAALVGALTSEPAEPAPPAGQPAPPPILGALVAARTDALEARAAALVPLVARLSALSDRMSPH